MLSVEGTDVAFLVGGVVSFLLRHGFGVVPQLGRLIENRNVFLVFSVLRRGLCDAPPFGPPVDLRQHRVRHPDGQFTRIGGGAQAKQLIGISPLASGVFCRHRIVCDGREAGENPGRVDVNSREYSKF